MKYSIQVNMFTLVFFISICVWFLVDFQPTRRVLRSRSERSANEKKIKSQSIVEADSSGPLHSVLTDFVVQNDIKSVVDTPCGNGDWQELWLKEVGKTRPITYLGLDHRQNYVDNLLKRWQSQYNQLRGSSVSFNYGDAMKEPINGNYDLIISRHALQYYSFLKIGKVLSNFAKSNAKHILIESYPSIQSNKDTPKRGHRFFDLAKPPFNIEADAIYALTNSDSGLEGRVHSSIMKGKNGDKLTKN